MLKIRNVALGLLTLFSFGSGFANCVQDYDFNDCCAPRKWQCGDIEFTGEFLLWQPRISGMPYAATNILTPVPNIDPIPNDIEYQAVEFGYRPGFRIEATYASPNTAWDLTARWTRFSNSSSDSVEVSGDRVISTFWEQFGLVVANTASSRLSVDLNSVDLDVGKTVDLFSCFSIRPYIGASYYRLNLNSNINYAGTFSQGPGTAEANIQLKDHSQGWGLNVGTDATWQLPYGLALFGKGSYSVYASKNNNSVTQHSVVPDAPLDLTLSTDDSFSAMSQVFKVLCGVSWDYAFCVRSWPLDLTLFAGYEVNYWPGQVELSRGQFAGSSNSLIPLQSPGNVGFQGLTTGLTLKF